MRYFKFIFYLLIFLFCSCTGIDNGDYLIDYVPPVPEGADVRNIVLEDYTGMRCSNCPKAASKTAALKEIYGDRLIPVSIHAGYFARPVNGIDLRTIEGEEYNRFYSITANPQGIVSRASYRGNRFYPIDMWEGAILNLPEKSAFGIDISVDYDKNKRLCIVKTSVSRFKNTEKTVLDLIIWLIEDNIITPQIVEDGSVVNNYIQHHVFRKSLNGTWGQRAMLPQYPGTTEKQADIEYEIPANFKDKDCSVIAMLCDRNTKEIIQAKDTMVILPEK